MSTAGAGYLSVHVSLFVHLKHLRIILFYDVEYESHASAFVVHTHPHVCGLCLYSVYKVFFSTSLCWSAVNLIYNIVFNNVCF